MRRAVGIPAGLGLLALAFVVTFTAPTDEQTQAPFAVSGPVGEQIVSSHLLVTVHDATLAREAVVDDWVGSTAGVWVALDATVEARIERTSIGADLYLGGVRYPASSRADGLEGQVVDAGLPRSGPLVFELPADILDDPAARSVVVRIGPGLDMRLDSVVELTLDLTALDLVDRVTLEAPRDGIR